MHRLNIYDHCATIRVDLLDLPSYIYDELVEHFFIDVDMDFMEMSLEDIQKYQIPTKSLTFDSYTLQTDLLEDLIRQQSGNYPYYLVYTEGYFKIANITELVNTLTQHNILKQTLNAYIINTIDNKGFSYFGLSYPKMTYIVGLTASDYNQLINVELSDIERVINAIFNQ